VLFGITKEGLAPGKYAPPGYQSDMPGFGSALSDDEIWTVLAYIASRWSPAAQAHQARIPRSYLQR
jgi:mono/diheme cytochrome c family protein